MKANLLLFLSLVVCLFPIFSQNAPQSSGGQMERWYYDADWNKTSQTNATYYLIREYVEPIMIMESVPTYEQGLQMKAKDTPFDRYLFNYHYTGNDQLALSVQAIVLKEDPNKYELDGAAVWYKKDGMLSAKGTYDGGKLVGEYVEFDENMNVVKRKQFMDGTEVNASANVYQPLVGKWVQITKEGDRTEKHLYNELKADGTLLIYSETYMRMFDEMNLTRSSEPSTFIWKYKETGPGKGDLEVYFMDGKLLGKEKVEIKGNSFTSLMYQHQNPSLVGEKYNFKKVN